MPTPYLKNRQSGDFGPNRKTAQKGHVTIVKFQAQTSTTHSSSSIRLQSAQNRLLFSFLAIISEKI